MIRLDLGKVAREGGGEGGRSANADDFSTFKSAMQSCSKSLSPWDVSISICLPSSHKASGVTAPSKGASIPVLAAVFYIFLRTLRKAVCYLVEHLGFGVRSGLFLVLPFIKYMDSGCYSTVLILEWGC